MQAYRDRQGDSGSAAYQAGDTWIQVAFKHGGVYLYDGTAPGADHVSAMIRLAKDGDGLNTYISQHVREHYAHRLS